MGMADQTRQQNARQRIAMRQAASRRAEAQRRLMVLGGSVLAVIAFVGQAQDPTHFGLTWQQIATDLKNPNNPVAQAIIGAANHITAAICKVTNGQPGNVCTSTGVTSVGGRI